MNTAPSSQRDLGTAAGCFETKWIWKLQACGPLILETFSWARWGLKETGASPASQTQAFEPDGWSVSQALSVYLLYFGDSGRLFTILAARQGLFLLSHSDFAGGWGRPMEGSQGTARDLQVSQSQTAHQPQDSQFFGIYNSMACSYLWAANRLPGINKLNHTGSAWLPSRFRNWFWTAQLYARAPCRCALRKGKLTKVLSGLSPI